MFKVTLPTNILLISTCNTVQNDGFSKCKQLDQIDLPSKFHKIALNVFCQAKLKKKQPLLPPPPPPLNGAKIKASNYF